MNPFQKINWGPKFFIYLLKDRIYFIEIMLKQKTNKMQNIFFNPLLFSFRNKI